jgi:hypothetical protein
MIQRISKPSKDAPPLTRSWDPGQLWLPLKKVQYIHCSKSLGCQLGQLDYNTLLKIVPQSSPLSNEISRSLNLVKPRVEAAQKKETAEMMDKLKGLGNSILGMPETP